MASEEPTIGHRIIEGLEGLVRDLEEGRPLRVRTVKKESEEQQEPHPQPKVSTEKEDGQCP